MNLGDQRASGVNDSQLAGFGFVAHRWRHAMGAENQHCAVRNLFNGFDKDRAAAAQLLDHVSVMHDFMVNIHWRTIGFEGQLDDIHRAHHAGAKAARSYTEQYSSIVMVLHFHAEHELTPGPLSYLTRSTESILIPGVLILQKKSVCLSISP